MPPRPPLASERPTTGSAGLICFDLDGTLLLAGDGRSARLFCALHEAADQRLPVPELSAIEWVGAGETGAVLERLCPTWPAADLAQALGIFGRLQAEAEPRNGYCEAPDARRVLERLSSDGYRLAVATNAPEEAAQRVLAELGLAPFLERVSGIRETHPRGKGARLRELVVDLAPGAAWMVGDSALDRQAAREAGVAFVHFMGSGAPPEECPGEDPRICRLAELLGLLGGNPEPC